MVDVAFSLRELEDLSFLRKADRDRMRAKLRANADGPAGRQHDAVPVVGHESTIRLRVGDWSIIFTVSNVELRVVRVGHRREVYR